MNAARRTETTNTASPQIALVTGMHRAGTSVLAKGVEALGFDLGKNLLAGAPENPKGFNEDVDVFDINEKLLTAIGLRWDLPTMFPVDDCQSDDVARLLRRANSFLSRRLSAQGKVVLKDPRFCILLPFWLELVKKSSANPSIVLALRHPYDVADSLQARNGMELRYSINLWRNYYLNLIRYTLDADISPVVVYYADLLAQPRLTLCRIARLLGFAIDKCQSAALAKFEREYVDTSLCHSSSGTSQELSCADLPEPERSIFELLLDASDRGWNPDKALDCVGRLDPTSAEAANCRLARRRLLAELTLLGSQQETLEEGTANDPAAVELRKNKELIALEHRKNLELVALERRKNEEFLGEQKRSLEELTELRAELKLKQEKLGSDSSELARYRQEAASSGERIKSLELELAERSSELARYRQEAASSGERIKSLELELAERSSELARYRQETASSGERIKSLELELAERSSELARYRQETASSGERIKSLELDLAERSSELAGAKTIADAAENNANQLQATLHEVRGALLEQRAEVFAKTQQLTATADAVFSAKHRIAEALTAHDRLTTGLIGRSEFAASDNDTPFSVPPALAGALDDTNVAPQQLDQLAEAIARFNGREMAKLKQAIDAARAARQSSLETDQHLRGTLRTVQDIRKSLSFRLGRAITFPARVVHDHVFVPAKRFPFSAFVDLVLLLVRHPVHSLRQINRTRLRNARITFFEKPASAKAVVSFYDPAMRPQLSYPTTTPATVPSVCTARDDARVSVISINFNGIAHLSPLLESLAEQSYRDIEVIIVDNGSTDGSAQLLKRRYPFVKLIALRDNLGFAEANNIATEIADGRYWCLLNNDMTVDHNCLRDLIRVIEAGDQVAAVGPKLRFWRPFLELTLGSDTPSEIELDAGALDDSLQQYKKVFFRDGWSDEAAQEYGRVRSFRGKAQFLVPIFKEQNCFRLRLRCSGSAAKVALTFTATEEQRELSVARHEWHDFEVMVEPGVMATARYLINNAGTTMDLEGNPRDRGFAEEDRGQFDATEEVDALCGGAMLIRPECLGDEPLFAGAMFAYFEDTDLSLRLRKNGYKLKYCGKATVYHKHASTSTENSAFFRFHVVRNRLLFSALHFKGSFNAKERVTRSELHHLEHYYRASGSNEEKEFAKSIPRILDDWEQMLPKIQAGTFYQREKHFPRIAVYNNFWTSLGGGERHAAAIAAVLQRFSAVDLVSERDFEPRALERAFGFDLKYCRKRILSPEVLHHTEVTAEYDVFVNSTFASDLRSRAAHAFYVISFPFRLEADGVERAEFLSNYQGFWANSVFTQGWTRKWWGLTPAVLYPVVDVPDEGESRGANKDKCILNVGRFFLSGHNKKQLELVQVFRGLYETGRVSKGWKLILVGQVHTGQEEYVEMVRASASGLPIEVLHDIDRQELDRLYERAAIYWHATGLNEDISGSPELFEHFGITTVEAMAHGCIPIVLDAGGQPEIVNSSLVGFRFLNEEGLIDATVECATLYEDDPAAFSAMSERARERARGFGSSRFERELLGLLADNGALVGCSRQLF